MWCCLSVVRVVLWFDRMFVYVLFCSSVCVVCLLLFCVCVCHFVSSVVLYAISSV